MCRVGIQVDLSISHAEPTGCRDEERHGGRQTQQENEEEGDEEQQQQEGRGGGKGINGGIKGGRGRRIEHGGRGRKG